MADSLVQDYRTKEEEQEDSRKNKVSFADISISAAWIAASYHAYSPEEIRKDIKKEWVKSVAKDISHDPKFKDVFASKQRRESRKEYTARRQEQVQIERLISDLVSGHSDQLFEKGLETQAAVRQSAAELIKNDYQNLETKQQELLTAITQSQNKLAETFKEQNDKNNQRFEKSSVLYKRKAQDLEKIKVIEKAEFQSQVAVRRDLKEALSTTTDKKEQQELIEQSVLSQKALAKVLASPQAKELTQEQFVQALRAQVNKELYDKRGHKRYKIKELDDQQLSRLGQYYSRFIEKQPIPINEPTSAIPQPTQPQTTVSTPEAGFKKQTSYSWPKPNLNFTKLDFNGLNSLLKSFFSGFNDWFGSLIGKASGLLSKLPGLGGLFGGGAAGAGATAATTATTAASTAAAAGAGATAGTAGAVGATATAGIWVPVAIVIILLLLVLPLIFYIFNNPVAKPQALIQAQQEIAPTASVAEQPTVKTAGDNLEEVMALTSQNTCTPLAMIKAISRREAPGTWNYSEEKFDFYNSYPWWTSDDINESNQDDQTKVCSGYGYDTCSNLIPADSKFDGQYCKGGPISGICAISANVMGPMQFEQGTWNGYKNKVEELLTQLSSPREADRRVILDAFLAAGLKLHNNSGATDCDNWTASEIENAAKLYYGKCIYTIGNGGNYCQEVCDYYNEYSTQTVNCSFVGAGT